MKTTEQQAKTRKELEQKLKEQIIKKFTDMSYAELCMVEAAVNVVANSLYWNEEEEEWREDSDIFMFEASQKEYDFLQSANCKLKVD